MTEEEAKKKRCCGPCPENTGVWLTTQEVPASGYFACTGSGCMAWRTYPITLGDVGVSYESSGYCGHIK